MAITLSWDNPEKTIVIEKIEGKWDLSETHQIISQVEAMAQEAGQPVDIIVDMTEAKGVPTNLTLAAGRADRVLRGRINRVVLVGANYYMETIMGVLFKIVPKVFGSVHFAKSVEEARALLTAQPTQ